MENDKQGVWCIGDSVFNYSTHSVINLNEESDPCNLLTADGVQFDAEDGDRGQNGLMPQHWLKRYFNNDDLDVKTFAVPGLTTYQLNTIILSEVLERIKNNDIVIVSAGSNDMNMLSGVTTNSKRITSKDRRDIVFNVLMGDIIENTMEIIKKVREKTS